jgi:hypothetical protein
MKLSELQQALKAADPAAVLVPPRVLDRIIQRVGRLTNPFGQVPHRQSLVVSRPILYRHVDPDELDLEPDRVLPETVLLLARPAQNTLATQERDALLLSYWRKLFHAAVHRRFGQLVQEGRLGPGEVAERIDQLGGGEFAEIRMVLDQERYLLPEAEDTAVYAEFAAVYLELRWFAASLVPVYFPSLTDPERVDRLLGRDIDAAELFNRTRLPGAPDPVVRTDTKSDESHDYYWRLMRTADRADRSGNTVRAAILRTRAARVAPAALTPGTRQDARADLERLMQRLRDALELSDEEVREWLKDLPALLDRADQGSNPCEAALLFDLQQVGVDHEREIYSLDLVEWILSAGRRPIKRPLPSQRLVRITKHLRAAAARLTQARLSDEERQHLARLMQVALERCEERLRTVFRPVLTDALTVAGLQPGNLPERVAFTKMVEEMLDRIIDVGFLTFSDLRDTLSRNQLKMPDLSDPQEFVRGDPLLRLDRRLATALDGVYRPSEFYLRWLERLTSPAFGTAVGRWLVLFVLVPFGGALLLLDGAQVVFDHTLPQAWRPPLFAPMHWLFPQAGKAAPTALTPAAVVNVVGGAAAGPGLSLAGPLAALTALEVAVPPRERVPLLNMLQYFIAVGFLLLGVMHSEPLRYRALQLSRLAWRVVRGLLYDLPVWLWSRPWLRQLWESWPFHLLMSFVLKPVVLCALLRPWVPEAFSTWFGSLTTFLAANFVINSRLGREFEDSLVQVLSDFYDLLRAGLLPGLFRLVMTLFKQVMDATEYVLFTVDEWLRFRSGDSAVSMVVRAVATVLWYPVAFLARFYLVVLIEPGFNPVKAPMSLLAAKFVYPILGTVMTSGLAGALQPALGRMLAYAIALVTVWLSPDIFGFLFWEMKENWSLYRANRRATLRAVPVGPSGEKVRQLLQPGFHSGTIPKLYARLRQAEREALQTGNWRTARAYTRSLQEVEQSLRRLVERELVTLLVRGPAWHGDGLGVGRVAPAPRRIRVELTNVTLPAEPAWLEWELQGDRLVASIPQPGWTARVGEAQREAVAAGLAGLYKLAGIDLVREQVRANVPAAADFDVAGHDLVLWTRPGPAPAALYDLDTLKGPLLPRTLAGAPAPSWPALDPARVEYGRVPLTWQRWVARWQADGDGKAPPPLFSPAVQLLSAGAGL